MHLFSEIIHFSLTLIILQQHCINFFTDIVQSFRIQPNKISTNAVYCKIINRNVRTALSSSVTLGDAGASSDNNNDNGGIIKVRSGCHIFCLHYRD